MDLDVTVTRATFSAAGEMQADVNEVGPEHVAESDLRRAMRRALQMQLGPVVVPEGGSPLQTRRLAGPGWETPIWPSSAATRSPIARTSNSSGAARTSLGGAVDLLKLALAVAEGRGEFAYLCTGAPVGVWEKPAACADLLSPGSWSTEDLFARHAREWRWLLAGNQTARPVRLPSKLETRAIASVPIHVAEGGDWELRAVGLAPVGRGWTGFDQGWPRSQAQSLAE